MADDSTTNFKSNTQKSSFLLPVLLVGLIPVIASIVVYQLDSFEAVPLPPQELTRGFLSPPRRNGWMLRGSETIGAGKLMGPEDVAFHPSSGVIYTGCGDGWLKRVSVSGSDNDSVVEDWVNTGGRPLGLVHGFHGELIVADANKGLLKVSENGVLELLTNSAEGQKFKLTDGVDIAKDGMIYFTDASHKYSLQEFSYDIFEGRPNGRFLSYDPSTQQTIVLVRDLYFPNGVSVSPDQTFVIFCETPLRKCKKYYIKGERKGDVGTFVERLPGLPDNIHYDGEGHYWIALALEITESFHLLQKYPFIRKVMAIITKYVGRPHMEKNGGVVAVDLEGNVMEYFHDPEVSLTSAIKRGDHLYCGSILDPYIIRLNLTRYPALTAAA